MNLTVYRNIIVIPIVTVVLTIAGCKKKEEPEDKTPTACFTTNKAYYKKMEPVQFTNCSSNYDRVEWYFGDGSGSTLSDASHQYPFPGIYYVRLKTFNDVNSKEITNTVKVGDSSTVAYSIGWDTVTISSSEMLTVRIYYRHTGEATWHDTDIYQYYFRSNSTTRQTGSFYLPDAAKTFRLKLEVSWYKSSGGPLPDIFSGKDSVITQDFHGFDGPKEPKLSSGLLFGKLAHDYSIGFK